MPHTPNTPTPERPSEPARPESADSPGGGPAGALVDPRDLIPAPGPRLLSATFGDFEGTEHESSIPDRPQWHRYRVVHTPTGSVLLDYAMDPTHLPSLLVATVGLTAEEDPATSDLYSGTTPGLENVRRNAQTLYESARRALGQA
ncbi:hypothetical protein ACIQF6_35750 [Kitasatospora sp. NPDC092948]|uniref:hypothetical protein n=1 Tax=Kitasatospora sp. NPDC092948 TaxID=3364088 RepID=UPI00382C716C